MFGDCPKEPLYISIVWIGGAESRIIDNAFNPFNWNSPLRHGVPGMPCVFQWLTLHVSGPSGCRRPMSLSPALPRSRLFLCRPAVVASVALVAERLPAAVLQHLQPFSSLIVLLR